jgi:phosphomevalonate kinase
MVTRTASAPGKLVLFGEYVVLEGAPALVAAMERRARVRFTPDAGQDIVVTSPTLRLSARFRVEAGVVSPVGEVPAPLAFVASLLTADGTLPRGGGGGGGELEMDTAAFFEGEHKLGLGSSAALSVAALAALGGGAAAAGEDAWRRQLASAAQAAHRRAQGDVGSGVDIAAAAYGGILRFQRAPADPIPQVAPLPASPRLSLLPVWSGRSAQTAPLLRAFAALKSRDAALYWDSCEKLAILSHAACEFWALGNADALLPVVREAFSSLEALGERCGVDIVTEEHRAIERVVRRQGAVYKPSGAGGGDLGVAFCPSRQVLVRVQSKLRSKGFQAMPMAIAATGVQVEATPSRR